MAYTSRSPIAAQRCRQGSEWCNGAITRGTSSPCIVGVPAHSRRTNAGCKCSADFLGPRLLCSVTNTLLGDLFLVSKCVCALPWSRCPGSSVSGFRSPKGRRWGGTGSSGGCILRRTQCLLLWKIVQFRCKSKDSFFYCRPCSSSFSLVVASTR